MIFIFYLTSYLFVRKILVDTQAIFYSNQEAITMGASISDIAQKANVSATTVSRALNNHGYVNEETKNEIIRIADELGYRPKQYKKRNGFSSSKLIGVVVPDIKNAYFGEIIRGIEEVTFQKGYDLLICDSAGDPGQEIRCISSLYAANVCGLIVAISSDVATYNLEYLQDLNDTKFPVVLVDRNPGLPGLDSVTFDNYGGSKKAVQVFIDNGHKDIAILCGPTTAKTGLERLNGYIDALRSNDIPIREEYILYGDFRSESGYRLTKKLLSSRKKVTAIFVSNRRMTLGCLRALKEMELKVPDDIAIISFGKSDFYSVLPVPISHVYQPVPPIGEECANILLKKLEMGKKYRKHPRKQSIFSTECILCGSEVYPVNRTK